MHPPIFAWRTRGLAAPFRQYPRLRQVYEE